MSPAGLDTLLRPPAPAPDASKALARLRALLHPRADGVLVAMSAGVDSCLLARVARDELGPRAACATVVSESTPPWERDDAVAFARRQGLRHVVLEHSELASPAYVRNDAMRCYHCREGLMETLRAFADRERLGTVALGVVLDDFQEHRPGIQAAAAGGAWFPLVEAGFTKSHARGAARALGLDVADRPSNACLSSRIPYGTPVTRDRLQQVALAEAVLRNLGFGQVRIRHHGDVARIELEPPELAMALQNRERILEGVRAAGFKFVALDLAGYRSGSLSGDVAGGREP